MQRDATTAAAETRSLWVSGHQRPAPGGAPRRSGPPSRAALVAEDARLRDAVRALISAIDSLP